MYDLCSVCQITLDKLSVLCVLTIQPRKENKENFGQTTLKRIRPAYWWNATERVKNGYGYVQYNAMFPALALVLAYWIENDTIGLFMPNRYNQLGYSTRISRLCSWLDLRCFMSWINHLPPFLHFLEICFIWQLVYTFDIMENTIFLVFDYVHA